MIKPLKYTIAVILRDAANHEKFLVVKRPDNDPDLRGKWGFPAATMLPGELPEDAARRVCREKLNCRAAPIRFVGAMLQKRNAYDIMLMDIEMIVQADSVPPDTAKSQTEGTAYIAQRWTTDPWVLMAGAKVGSCCSSIFLTDRGLLNRQEWLQSLEGSSSVG